MATLVLAMSTLSLGASSPAEAAVDKIIANPDSIAHGRSLAGWLRAYWTGVLDTGAEEDGNVLFMPIPEGDYTGEGDFTPDNPGVFAGTADVTIETGTPFVLPLTAWIGESTDPVVGRCDPIFDDPSLPDALFGSEDINAIVTLDGLPIVVDNQAFYVPRTDLGCITTGYPRGEFTAAVFFQAIGFVAHPLPPGEHTLTLDGKLIVRDGSIGPDPFGVRFLNTWNITVEP